MSPRSDEYMEQARERLAGAQKILGLSATFVAPGEFDQGLSALARQAKEAREKGDYEATPPTAEQAAEFVAATERMLGA